MAAVVLAVSFGLIQRAAQRRRGHYFTVTGINYALAALVALAWVAVRGGWEASALAYWVGALNGVGFAVLIVLQYFMLGQRGVGITFALGSLALLAPITVSLVVFGGGPLGWEKAAADIRHCFEKILNGPYWGSRVVHLCVDSCCATREEAGSD